MNKWFIGIGLLLIIGIVGAVAINTVYTAQQFVKVNLNNYDFELKQAGFRITDTDYVWDINAVTANKYIEESGNWLGKIKTEQLQRSYSYSKKSYRSCRETNTANECKSIVIALIKTEVLRQINEERERLKVLQKDANDIINGNYDSEWTDGNLGELN